MSNVAKLKKEAADLEKKNQFDKALKVYVKLLGEFERHPQEVDVTLFNRVGDIQVKLGQVAEGMDTYEKAVDAYADGGFANNAIAMCKKILRQTPGRASVYYKLGKISAQEGFKAEARQNFLEYADRMEKGGNTTEAFRALMEFMDLVPDQDDIRSMLADQLTKAKRPADALEQLQSLHERYSNDDKLAEAEAVADRIRAIDPNVELRSGSDAHKSQGGDLVFIDLDAPTTSAIVPEPPPRVASPPPQVAKPTPAPPPPIKSAPAAEPPPPPEPMEITRASDEGDTADVAPGGGLDIEPTSFSGDVDRSSDSVEIEPTSFGDVSLDTPAAATASVTAANSRPVPAPVEEEMTLADVSLADRAAEPALLDLGSVELPPSAIAPVMGPPATAQTESIELLDLDVVEPEQPPPTPPPVVRPSIAVTPPKPVATPLTPPKASPAPAMPDFDLSPAASSRKSTIFAAKALNLLSAAVQATPEDWSLRRELAEAMLEAGDRGGGVAELDVAMNGAENNDDLELATEIAEELGRLEPQVVKHHQKRVEYAFRRNDRPRLVEAYLTLADALVANDQSEKARAVYQRVLALAPDNMQAQAAVETIAPPSPPVAPPVAASRASAPAKRPSASKPSPTPPTKPTDDGGFVNLGDWLREDEGQKDTRMVVDEKEPTGDENADFADMLKKFKQGVSENVDAEDYQSHYDLAIAFKEMGLIDEAIAGFQRALGAKTNRLPTYEALGECFLDKGQAKMAAAILQRGVNEPGVTEDQLVGVLYLLGRAAEAQGQAAQALDYYQRVAVTQIEFRDVADRMNALEKAPR